MLLIFVVKMRLGGQTPVCPHRPLSSPRAGFHVFWDSELFVPEHIYAGFTCHSNYIICFNIPLTNET